MTTPLSNETHADLSTPGELRIVRFLPGPIERVWDFLTDPAKRSRWFCGGATATTPGGKIEFAMHHAKLSPGETPPANYAHVHEPGVTFEGRVLRYEPPHALSYTFGSNDSVVLFELSPHGDQVRLVLTHRSTGEDLKEQTNYAGGWHTHLALLAALLEQRPLPPFWATFAHVSQHYRQVRAGM